MYRWMEEDCYIYKKTNKRSRNNNKNLIILHIKNKK
jgi:hypothetical protein